MHVGWKILHQCLMSDYDTAQLSVLVPANGLRPRMCSCVNSHRLACRQPPVLKGYWCELLCRARLESRREDREGGWGTAARTEVPEPSSHEWEREPGRIRGLRSKTFVPVKNTSFSSRIPSRNSARLGRTRGPVLIGLTTMSGEIYMYAAPHSSHTVFFGRTPVEHWHTSGNWKGTTLSFRVLLKRLGEADLRRGFCPGPRSSLGLDDLLGSQLDASAACDGIRKSAFSRNALTQVRSASLSAASFVFLNRPRSYERGLAQCQAPKHFAFLDNRLRQGSVLRRMVNVAAQ